MLHCSMKKVQYDLLHCTIIIASRKFLRQLEPLAQWAPQAPTLKCCTCTIGGQTAAVMIEVVGPGHSPLITQNTMKP